MTTYYTVGVITKPHGLRGEVRVYSRTDFPELRFGQGSILWVRKTGQSPIAEVEVQSGRKHQNMWIVSFKDLTTVHDVEHWRSMELCIPDTALAPLPEGAHYIHELVGLDVYKDDGTYIGELTDVLTPGANDVYVVRRATSSSDILLPAIPSCILRVDVQSKCMTVHLLPGLIDDDGE